MNTTAIARFLAAIRSRRALLGGGLAALALALAAGDDSETTAHQRNRRQHRKRHDRRRRRHHDGGDGVRGDADCDVCESGCQFTSIQAAIDAAQDQGFMQFTVCPGKYKERISIGPSVVSSLTILASSSLPEDTTIDADGDGSAITVLRGAFATIENFTITGGEADFGGGIVNRGFLTVRNCVVTDNDTGLAAGGGGGIYNDEGHLTLSLTTVSDNKASGGQGGGILNAGGTLALQENTQITKNSASQGGGIFNETGGTVTVDDTSGVTDNTPNNCVGTNACGA